jgi:predicted dehydrogenase
MAPRARAVIVGTGGIARAAHLPALRELAGRVELTGVVDVDPSSREAFASESGAAAFASLPEALEAARPDLVILCTPPGLHAEHAELALRAGAWVLAEKPPCASLAEADAILAAARAGGAQFATVYQWRFGGGALQLRRLLAEGTIGPVLVAQCHTLWHRPDAYYALPWRGRWATEVGGPTVGHAIHAIDLLRHLLGPWEEVHAVMARRARPIETEDVSLATVRFEGGALASLTSTVLAPREQSWLRIDTPQATIELDRHWRGGDDWGLGIRAEHWRATERAGETDAPARVWPPPREPAHAGHAGVLADVLDAMRDGGVPSTGGASAFAALELLTGIYASAFSGRPVRRAELGAGTPFHGSLRGADPRAAEAVLGA